MTQSAALYCSPQHSFTVTFPAAETELLPGVVWGDVGAFPTPAYWAYQTFSRRLLGQAPVHRLGETLKEEVAACLLGGHGIPATVGLAAFQRLKALGFLNQDSVSEQSLVQALMQPLTVSGRTIKYRFAAQKGKYLAKALDALSSNTHPSTPLELRNWLLQIPGIGYKTASWVVRNWTDSDDVAILDVHILRVGRAIGLFPSSLSVEKNYVALEELFLRWSRAINIRASELDAVIWAEMASSPLSVRQLDIQLAMTEESASPRPKHRHANPRQLRMAV